MVKNDFWMRMFLEEINIGNSRLSEEICPHQYGWASCNPWVLHETKRTNSLLLSLLTHEYQSFWLSSFHTVKLKPVVPWFSGLWPQTWSNTISLPDSQP